MYTISIQDGITTFTLDSHTKDDICLWLDRYSVPIESFTEWAIKEKQYTYDADEYRMNFQVRINDEEAAEKVLKAIEYRKFVPNPKKLYYRSGTCIPMPPPRCIICLKNAGGKDYSIGNYNHNALHLCEAHVERLHKLIG
jgi:hypothetical protein